MRPRSIRLERLLLLLVLATTVPVSLFAGLLGVRSWRDHRTFVERQNVDTARAIAVAVDQEVESNSIKFTPKGGRITVRLGVEGSEAVMRVADTGIGIEPELLPHVFQRFRQGDTSASPVHGGLGIGLALVRHMVELHGGTVQAESDGRGRGSVFTVRLPLPARPSLATPPLGAPDAIPAVLDSARMLERLRVLVVDDDPDARELVGTALRQAGARVTPAASMRDALEIVDMVTPDVLVSDIGMPNGTGYEFVKRVRALERTAEVPVIALTAYARAEDRERALDAGFDFHVGKPVEPLVLVRAVAVAAGRA
jgi:CheY-like chemotaxis protein